MSDIIEVAARVNYEALRALVDEVVTERLKRLIQRPISEMADHHDADDAPEEETTYSGPRRNQILRAGSAATPAKPKTPKTPKAPKKPKATTATAATATAATAADAAERIATTLRAHPEGIRGVALRGLLGWGKGFYSYHMKQAAARNLLKVKGEKGGATYFPNEKGIERFMVNGVNAPAPAETSAAN